MKSSRAAIFSFFFFRLRMSSFSSASPCWPLSRPSAAVTGTQRAARRTVDAWTCFSSAEKDLASLNEDRGGEWVRIYLEREEGSHVPSEHIVLVPSVGVEEVVARDLKKRGKRRRRKKVVDE